MPRFILLAALAALTAVPLAFAPPAAAQAVRFCNNALSANAFYSNVRSNGRTADVEYHGQFQNIDPNRRRLTATMVSIARVGNFNVLRPIARFELRAFEQKDITLLTLQTANPAGTGAPTPAQLGAQIRFTCAFN